MAKDKPSKTATSYVQRLLEDEYVQNQVRDAAAGVRSAYLRARRRPAQAPQDKKFYDNVRQAAVSMRKAVTAIKRQPEPPPKPKHRVRKVAAAVVIVGGSAFIIAKRGQSRPAGTETAGSAPTSNGASERMHEAETAATPPGD